MCSYLSLRVTSEGLHNLPDSGDNPHGVAAHHEHHYVHTHPGQQDLALSHFLLIPHCCPIMRLSQGSAAGRHLLKVVQVVLNFPVVKKIQFLLSTKTFTLRY